ncbi:hypothetical protein RclHR1_22870003 [Rhizophagus clarus]|uniref:Uncharacterized protein n=1 Tax=Rhizophagus clarus TaxID=94130 RepID=A0A2Z6R8J3_9GLOM|nr:hypothetical protein RclHR1_22870003 [Rhizophagus clarus]GES97323.1 hypothetical protein GLOIN_2v1732727 [Rhizophagus clarus]
MKRLKKIHFEKFMKNPTKKGKTIKDKNKTQNQVQQQPTTYDNESDEFERFKAAFQQVQLEKESLENENKSLKDEIIKKDQSFNDYENRLATYKEKYENVKKTLITLQNDRQELLDSFGTKYLELKRAFEELNQKYNDKNNSFEELKQEYNDQSNSFEEFKQKYNDQNDSFEELKQKYSNQSDKFEELNQKYKDQNANLEELKQKYINQKDNFEELKQKYSNQSDKFEELNQKYKNQNANLEELNQKYINQKNNFEESKRKRDEQILALEILKQKFKDQNYDFEKFKQKYKDQKVSFEELSQKYNDQGDNFEELKQKHEDQALAFEELKQKYKDQIGNLDELKQNKEYFESQYNISEQQLKEKNSLIKSLKQKNKDLEDEAAKYQSALGIATNFDFNVDDPNNNVKLGQDILSLQDTLENYVTNLKPKIDVDINKIRELLLKYGCQSKISDEEPNRPLIKAVLQRYALEEILAQADFYFESFKDSNKDHHLESKIISQVAVLNDLMKKFYNDRLGDDEITRITPIRLRQQVYTALGTRGFNDIRKIDGNISKHNFIDIVPNTINNMMDKCRKINDIKKKKYVNALAEDLVRNVVRIFYFRLRIQEPTAQYHWFHNNERINKSYMKGSWDEDEIEDMVVEVCCFPMIYKPEDDGDKICTPAKVFPIHIMKEQSLGEKLMDLGMSIGRKFNIYSSNDDSKFDELDEYDSDQANLTEPEEHFHDKTFNDQVIVY